MTYIIYLGAIITSIICLFFGSPIKDIGVAILGAILFELLKSLLNNASKLKLFIVSSIKYRNKQIRVSISYLFKIKIDDKYLLVRGKRINNQFQPVGGVYKRFPESKDFFMKLEVLDDDNIKIDDKSKDDLRIRVKGKNLSKLINWYKDGKCRENSVFREFYEELVAPGIVSPDIFPYINYRHIKTNDTGIRWCEYFQCYEILIAEIYELIPNVQQESALRELLQKKNNEYIWAEEEDIKRRGVNKNNLNSKISESSQWIVC